LLFSEKKVLEKWKYEILDNNTKKFCSRVLLINNNPSLGEKKRKEGRKERLPSF